MQRKQAIELVLTQAAARVYDPTKKTGVWESVGPNRSPDIDRMNKRANAPLGSPWCASFVAECGAVALGSVYPVPLTPDCDVLLAWGRKRGLLHTKAARGDIFLVLNPSDHDDATHTGFATTPGDTTTQTIEGNTNDDGGREGWKTARRVRTYGSRLVFVRWADFLDDVDAEGNGWTIKVGPKNLNGFAENNQTFVKFRDFMGALFGADADKLIGWDANDGVTWGGNPLPSSIPRRSINNETFVGVRAVATWIGLGVTPDAGAKIVQVFNPATVKG